MLDFHPQISEYHWPPAFRRTQKAYPEDHGKATSEFPSPLTKPGYFSDFQSTAAEEEEEEGSSCDEDPNEDDEVH